MSADERPDFCPRLIDEDPLPEGWTMREDQLFGIDLIRSHRVRFDGGAHDGKCSIMHCTELSELQCGRKAAVRLAWALEQGIA